MNRTEITHLGKMITLLRRNDDWKRADGFSSYPNYLAVLCNPRRTQLRIDRGSPDSAHTPGNGEVKSR